MIITVEATYENGILRPTQPLPLKEREKVQVTLYTPIDRVTAVSRVRATAGLLGWTGDAGMVERIALDDEFGILEAP